MQELFKIPGHLIRNFHDVITPTAVARVNNLETFQAR